MNDVATQCNTQRHHPEWSNVYNRVFVRWTTHRPAGLSSKDLVMADACDKFAAREESKDVSGEAGNAKTSDQDLQDLTGSAGNKTKEEAAKQKEKEKIEQEERPDGAEGSLEGIGGQPT